MRITGFALVLILVALMPLYAAAQDYSGEYDYSDENASYDSESFDGTESGTGLEFHGYECTFDCSGHRAGYEWAERKGIYDEDDCGGNSNSFVQGCRAYVQQQ